MKTIAFIFLMVFTNFALAAGSCDSFFESSLLDKAIENYQRVLQIDAQFANYKPGNYPITLFQTGSNQNCAVLVQGSDIRKFTLAKPFGNIKQFATIIQNHTSSEETPVEYQEILQKLNIRYSLLVNLNVFAKIEELHLKGKAIDWVDAGYNWISLIVHEGFHLFVQTPYDYSDSPILSWPSWDHQPNRDVLSSVCYKDPKVSDLLKEELKSIQKAVHAILVENDRNLTIQFAKEYLEWRKKRQELQLDERVPASYSADEKVKISCAQAEAIMEIEEGIPEFLGMQTAIISKTGTKEKASEYIESWEPSQNHLYYMTGAAQLFIMAELDRPRYFKATYDLLKSTNWKNGLDFQFEKFLEETSLPSD